MRILVPVVSSLAILSAAALADVPPQTPQEAAMRAHVAFLASDEMKGRDAGSAEFDRAAAYVADQFRVAGLKPAGDGGTYLQQVPLLRYAAYGPGTVTIAGRRLPEREFTTVPNPAAAATKRGGEVVFVGYGVVGPDGVDDYAGVDVKGKIVAFLPGVPANFTGDDRAFLSSATNKMTFAAERGAIGAVQLATAPPAKTARPPRPRFTWATDTGAGFTPHAATPILAELTEAGARRLFASRPGAWDAVKAAVAARRRPATMALGTQLEAESATAFAPVPSSNVVGLLPGSDKDLSREIVVLSAHLDHIGVSLTPDATGDAINNGAMDDAIGIASLIEEAKRFGRGRAPKRSILFLAVTAEEKGLIGSDYFVHHQPKRFGEIVADVNLDMPILTYTFQDLVAFGGDRSTLGPIIARAAKDVGVTMSPDPVPEMGIFVRSDHFRFVQQGIPSVFLWPGHKGDGKAAYEAFFATRYHKPADDLTQPIRWDQGVRFVDANYRIARGIADAPVRPLWNRGEYFARLYGGVMAR